VSAFYRCYRKRKARTLVVSDDRPASEVIENPPTENSHTFPKSLVI